MSTAPNRPPITSVIHNGACIGFVFNRGRGFEAFDADERSLGTFVDGQAAVAAVLNHIAAQP